MSYKLLLIDDHPETLSIIQRVLEQNGYNVLTARSGFRGLTLAEQEQPDLVLVDGMMPEMDGWEVVRRLRQHATLADMPIIMFSAVGEAEQKLAGFDAGADDYLTKPTEPEELLERVQMLLENVAPRHADNGPETDIPVVDPFTTQRVELFKTPIAAPTGSLPAQTRLIAVVGARGGVGATTVAINLATSSSMFNLPTTLVDLDLVQGHVALYLKQKVDVGLQKMAHLGTAALQESIHASMVPYRDHLQLVLARSNIHDKYASLSVNQVKDMLAALQQPGATIVVDAGRGTTAVSHAVIEQADHVILCLRPERLALAAAKKLIAHWQAVLFPTTHVGSLLLDFYGGREIPSEAIEAYLEQPLLSVIPIQPQELAQAVNKGKPLVELFPQNSASARFRRLAQQLVKA